MAAALPALGFWALMGLQAYLIATCPAGASCSFDPTESAMSVAIYNDEPDTVTVVAMNCPPDVCRSTTLLPGDRFEAATSDGGVENLYMVRSAAHGVLGCFPLLYWRHPASEPVLAVSQAGECLRLRNDTHEPIVVEVKCPVDCDWSPMSDAIQPGRSDVAGLDAVHAFRVVESTGPAWWPTPGRVVGCLPAPATLRDATLRVSSLPRRC